MPDGSTPENTGRSDLKAEVIRIEERIDGLCQSLRQIGFSGHSEKSFFAIDQTSRGEVVSMRMRNPRYRHPESENEVGFSTNLNDGTGLSRRLGLKDLHYYVSVSKIAEDGATILPGERGGIYGEFYFDKTGNLVKLIQIPKEDLREEDEEIKDSYPSPKYTTIIDKEALNPENIPGIIEGLGSATASLSIDVPKIR